MDSEGGNTLGRFLSLISFFLLEFVRTTKGKIVKNGKQEDSISLCFSYIEKKKEE